MSKYGVAAGGEFGDFAGVDLLPARKATVEQGQNTGYGDNLSSAGCPGTAACAELAVVMSGVEYRVNSISHPIPEGCAECITVNYPTVEQGVA